MTLTVYSLGAYASYPDEEIKWRRRDYDINKLVKAVKGKPFKGYSIFEGKGGRVYRIEPGKESVAFDLFSRWASKTISRIGDGPYVLVPVPSSKATSFIFDSAPMRLAQSIADRSPDLVRVRPWLRFFKEMKSSHDGGKRSKRIILSNLRASVNVRNQYPVILVDDVKTTGAHLLACAEFLRERNVEVAHAIVVASTVWEQIQDPLRVDPVDLEPEEDWDF